MINDLRKFIEKIKKQAKIVKYREVFHEKMQKRVQIVQKYKCRDDRRVVLMLNRNAVVVQKFFEERAGKPSPYIKIKKPKTVKYSEVFG